MNEKLITEAKALRSEITEELMDILDDIVEKEATNPETRYRRACQEARAQLSKSKSLLYGFCDALEDKEKELACVKAEFEHLLNQKPAAPIFRWVFRIKDYECPTIVMAPTRAEAIEKAFKAFGAAPFGQTDYVCRSVEEVGPK